MNNDKKLYIVPCMLLIDAGSKVEAERIAKCTVRPMNDSIRGLNVDGAVLFQLDTGLKPAECKENIFDYPLPQSMVPYLDEMKYL